MSNQKSNQSHGNEPISEALISAINVFKMHAHHNTLIIAVDPVVCIICLITMQQPLSQVNFKLE